MICNFFFTRRLSLLIIFGICSRSSDKCMLPVAERSEGRVDQPIFARFKNIVVRESWRAVIRRFRHRNCGQKFARRVLTCKVRFLYARTALRERAIHSHENFFGDPSSHLPTMRVPVDLATQPTAPFRRAPAQV